MPEDEKPKEEAKDEKVEEKKEENVEKTSEFDKLAGLIGDLTKSISTSIESQNNRFATLEKQIAEVAEKAMEKPTDMPAKPKVTAEDDIGDKTEAPDEYQSVSRQAGVRDASPEDESETDEKGLKMEKSDVKKFDQNKFQTDAKYTTESTPRPGGVQDVTKGMDETPAMKLLNDIRKGFDEGQMAPGEALSRAGREINKLGSYGEGWY